MKNKFVYVALSCVMMLFASCAGDGQSQPTSENYGGYKVQKLFTVDGVTVYRFNDNGYCHYFTNRTGTVMERHSSGKTTFEETIECE